MVRLSLRSDFPQALGIALILPSYTFALSCPIQPVWGWGDKKGSANTLVLPHVSGEVSEAYVCFVLPLSCPIQPIWCWGDKKGSANTLVLLHVSGEVSEAYVCFAHFTRSRINLPQGCVPPITPSCLFTLSYDCYLDVCFPKCYWDMRNSDIKLAFIAAEIESCASKEYVPENN